MHAMKIAYPRPSMIADFILTSLSVQPSGCVLPDIGIIWSTVRGCQPCCVSIFYAEWIAPRWRRDHLGEAV